MLKTIFSVGASLATILLLSNSASADEIELPVSGAVIQCNTCVTKYDYQNAISNHHRNSLVENMDPKSSTRFNKRWEMEYTVINENRQESAMVSYVYIEMNDPEAGIYETSEGYKYIHGTDSQSLVALYAIASDLFELSSNGRYIARSRMVEIKSNDPVAEFGLHTIGMTDMNATKLMDKLRNKLLSQYSVFGVTNVDEIINQRAIHQIRVTDNNGNAVYVFYALHLQGKLLALPDTLTYFDKNGNRVDVPWPAMTDGGLIKISGGGADWTNGTGGMLMIHYASMSGSGTIQCQKNGKKAICRTYVSTISN
jgi:hypothetical protein